MATRDGTGVRADGGALALLGALLDRSVEEIAGYAADARRMDRHALYRTADVWDNNTSPLVGAALARTRWGRERRARRALRWMADFGERRQAWIRGHAAAAGLRLDPRWLPPQDDRWPAFRFDGEPTEPFGKLTGDHLADLDAAYDLAAAEVRVIRVERFGDRLDAEVSLALPRAYPATAPANSPAELHLSFEGVTSVRFDARADGTVAAGTDEATERNSAGTDDGGVEKAAKGNSAGTGTAGSTAAGPGTGTAGSDEAADRNSAGTGTAGTGAAANTGTGTDDATASTAADPGTRTASTDAGPSPRSRTAGVVIRLGPGGEAALGLGARGEVRAAACHFSLLDMWWAQSPAGRKVAATAPRPRPRRARSPYYGYLAPNARAAAAVLRYGMLRARRVRSDAHAHSVPLSALTRAFAGAGTDLLAAAAQRTPRRREAAFRELVETWIRRGGPALDKFFTEALRDLHRPELLAAGRAARVADAADPGTEQEQAQGQKQEPVLVPLGPLPPEAEVKCAWYAAAYTEYGLPRGAYAVVHLAVPPEEGSGGGWRLRGLRTEEPAEFSLRTEAFAGPAYAEVGGRRIAAGGGALAVSAPNGWAGEGS